MSSSRLCLWSRVFCSRCLRLFLPVLLLASCSRAPVLERPGFAFVRFENLTGDPSLEWLGRAASEVLSASLAGVLEGPVISTSSVNRIEALRGNRPSMVPGISAQRPALILSGARRMVSGYFERSGNGVRFHVTDEDISTAKTVRTFSASGPASVETMMSLARKFSSGAHAYLTGNNQALELYTEALESPPAAAEEKIRAAIAADPEFGPAWTVAARVALAGNKRDEALKIIEDAQGHKLDALSVATLKLEKAALQGDEPGRVAALKEIIDIDPGDTSLLRQLAESKTATGEFAESAAIWQKLGVTLHDDVDVWNQTGYTRAWSGDYTGAVKAMAEYARIRPKDANPSDSTGDINFMYRKYPEAVASYMESIAKEPDMQAGASLYKAAWAKFYAGDRAAGDKLMDQLRVAREKVGVTNFHLFQADWFYRTGRQKEAVALLRKESQSQDGADAKAACFEQLVIWDLLAGDRALAAKDAQAVGPPKNALGALAHFVSLPSASAEEWQKRGNAMLPGPALNTVRRLALGYALLLDGKKEDALPVWEQIYSATPLGDFATRAVYTKLRGEQPKLAVLPNPNGVNQFAALIDKL